MSETDNKNVDSSIENKKSKTVVNTIKQSISSRENSMVIEGIGMFVAAGLGMAAIVGVYIIGLFGTDIFTDASQQLSPGRIYDQFEFLLVIIGVTFSGLNYSMLAGLVGIELGSQLRDYWRAVGSAAVGAGIGAIVFLFIITVVLIGSLISIQASVSQVAPVSQTISFQETFDLSILEWIGAFVVFTAGNGILGVFSGAIGGISAHITHQHVNNSK